MIRLRSGIGLAGAILAIVAVAACTQAPPPSREDVLISLTDELFVPRFQSVAGRWTVCAPRWMPSALTPALTLWVQRAPHGGRLAPPGCVRRQCGSAR